MYAICNRSNHLTGNKKYVIRNISVPLKQTKNEIISSKNLRIHIYMLLPNARCEMKIIASLFYSDTRVA